jgi:hypothetical protein
MCRLQHAQRVGQSGDRLSLRRSLSAGVNATSIIELLEPGTLFGDRLYHGDLRATRNFNLGPGGCRTTPSVRRGSEHGHPAPAG